MKFFNFLTIANTKSFFLNVVIENVHSPACLKGRKGG
jgi:hypothetical protein